MAKRYTPKEKEKVVAFIRAYNQQNGRGGQSAAVKKYSISPITVRNWLDRAGDSSSKDDVFESEPKPSISSAASRRGITPMDALRRMTEIQQQISKLGSEYDALKGAL